ncbi:MAG: N-acetylgalactosamine-6-sulfatase, partial [Planctomycetota bacterium]|nr:N-acetylgalactosamine-6-sulfatase [Planctomycetota bacterium]
PAKTRHELFNLASDPYENENLAQKKPKVLKRMMETLVAALQAESALYPVNADGSVMQPEIPQ